MALSNDYTSCQILNLDPTDPKRGPFVVTQSSVDADDPAQRESLFLLRRDGAWIEYATHALTPESERVPVAFDALGDIIKLMQGLPSKPTVVRNADLNQAELKQFLLQVRAEGGMLTHIRGNVARYKAQKSIHR